MLTAVRVRLCWWPTLAGRCTHALEPPARSPPSSPFPFPALFNQPLPWRSMLPRPPNDCRRVTPPALLKAKQLDPSCAVRGSDEEEQEDAAAASPPSASSVAREWSTALRRTKAIAARLRTELATARSLAAEGEAVRERAATTAGRLATHVEALEKLFSSA